MISTIESAGLASTAGTGKVCFVVLPQSLAVYYTGFMYITQYGLLVADPAAAACHTCYMYIHSMDCLWRIQQLIQEAFQCTVKFSLLVCLIYQVCLFDFPLLKFCQCL